MSPDQTEWRVSSFSSGGGGNCVQVAAGEGGVLVRNSNRIAEGALQLTPATAAAFVFACRAGTYDDLAAI